MVNSMYFNMTKYLIVQAFILYLGSCSYSDLPDIDRPPLMTKKEYIETRKLLKDLDSFREVQESDVPPKVWKQIQAGKNNLHNTTKHPQ